MYWEVAARSFRRQSTYRAATLAGLFTNTVFGFAKAEILIAALEGGRRVGGYSTDDAITYAFLSQSLIMLVSVFGPGIDLAARIRTGDVAIDLYRPIDFQGYWLATDAGRAAFQAIARGVPPMLVAVVAYGVGAPSAAGAVWFLVAAAVALVVSFGLRYLVCLSTFWLLDDRGPSLVFLALANFLGGLFLPLALFPPGWARIARASPFAILFQVPIDGWLGKPVAGQVLQGLAWAVGLVALGRVVERAATRKVVVQGG